MAKFKDPPLGPLTGSWYTPKPMETTPATEEVDGGGKQYVYDDDEEGEVGESEGRWKR